MSAPSSPTERPNPLLKLQLGSKLQVYSTSKQEWCDAVIDKEPKDIYPPPKTPGGSAPPGYRELQVRYDGRTKTVRCDDPKSVRLDPKRMRGLTFDISAEKFKPVYDILIPEPESGEIRVKVKLTLTTVATLALTPSARCWRWDSTLLTRASLNGKT